MRQKKRYLILFTMVVLLLGYFIFGFRASAYGGFPIPKEARMIKNNGEKSVEEYEWWLASEENGLPLYYQAVINLKGWKKIDQVGAMSTYEKDNNKVNVIFLENYLSVRSVER